MFFPADQKQHATDGEVTQWPATGGRSPWSMAQQKMIVLGSAHTHPYRAGRDEVEAIPSIGDMESWKVPDLTCGIANVVEGSDRKKKCGDIAWHGQPIKPRREL